MATPRNPNDNKSKYEQANMNNLIEELVLKRNKLEKNCYSQLNEVLMQKKRIKKLKLFFHRDKDLQSTIYTYNKAKSKEKKLRRLYIQKAEHLNSVEDGIIQSKYISAYFFRKQWKFDKL